MTDHNAITNWPRQSDSYAPNYEIGSEGENGEHLRDTSGWPYSIFRRATEIGIYDAVICNGIQHLGDAHVIAAALERI